jgi:membrane-associated protein
MHEILQFFLHPDEGLRALLQNFGPSIYGILWLVVFAETGLIIFPFFPGDSLLFASGMFCNPGFWVEQKNPGAWHPNIWIVCLTFFTASIAGDSVNFWIGRKLGIKLFKENSKLFKMKHLEATHAFFDRHGAKAIIIGRFVPIVRTLVPFVAGLQKISYRRFLRLSITGSIFWVGICCGAGYALGTMIPPEDFDKAILMVVGITVLAGGLEALRSKLKRRSDRAKASKKVEPEQV